MHVTTTTTITTTITTTTTTTTDDIRTAYETIITEDLAPKTVILINAFLLKF
jgi:hypothetical protein